MSESTISVTILTKNSEAHLKDCLESVKWAKEIIVLDSGSTDQTLEISKRYTDKVYVTEDWPGFGIQKNRALVYATSDWILSLDSDEVVSPSLAEAIQKTIAEPAFDHYQIKRESFYLNKHIRFGSWGHDRPLRLFKRGTVKFDQAIIHESMLREGESGVIKEPIFHYTFDSITEALEKNTRYAQLGAEKKFSAGEKSNLTKAILKGLFHFLRTYILKLGFLDGKEGLMIGIGNFFNRYYRELILWEMHKNQNSTQ